MPAEYPEDGLLIWGAGAMGGTIGATLTYRGYNVTLVDVNEAHVAAIEKNGMEIRGPVAQFTTPVDVQLPHKLNRKWRVVFLAVKVQYTVDACRALLPHLAPDGAVLSLQNGLGFEIAANIIGRERTYATVGPVAGDVGAPGVINFMNGGKPIPIGQIDGKNGPIADEILAAASVFSPGSYLVNNVQANLWSKFCFGTITSASSMAKSSIDILIEREDLRPMWTGLIREVMAVSKANGTYPEKSANLQFDPDAFEPGAPPELAQTFWDWVIAVSRPGKKPYSGSWLDLAAKRKTEVAAIQGPICDMGNRYGIKTPLLRRTISIITDIEEGRREQNDDNLREMLAVLSPAEAVSPA